MPLTEDDLAALSHEAMHGGDVAAISAQILTAVDNADLADPADAAYALTLVAELADQQEDLGQALALMRRAAALTGQDDEGDFATAYLGELLLRNGLEDEGLAQLTSLRPAMATDLLTGRQVAEALEQSGRTETALEWLTEALVAAIERGATLSEDDDESVTNAEVIYDLVAVRHRQREELGLEHDEYDQLFHELDESLAQQEPPDVLLFWPQDAFERLRAEWPAVAEAWEPTWDEHRLGIERTLQHWSGRGATDIVLLVGSADALVAYAQREELSLADPDDLDEAEQGYLDELADDPQAVRQPWPPRRNDTCWCGSGEKYKKCCLIRSRV